MICSIDLLILGNVQHSMTRLRFLFFLFLNIIFTACTLDQANVRGTFAFLLYLFRDKLVFQESHNSPTQNKIKSTFFTLDFIPKRVLLKTSKVFIKLLSMLLRSPACGLGMEAIFSKMVCSLKGVFLNFLKLNTVFGCSPLRTSAMWVPCGPIFTRLAKLMTNSSWVFQSSVTISEAPTTKTRSKIQLE